MSYEGNAPAGNSQVVVPLSVHEKHATHDLPADLAKAYELIVGYLGRADDLTEAEKANYADTAVRAAKAFRDLTLNRTAIVAELKHILSTGFPMDHTPGNPRPGLIVQGPISVFGLCPHHLLQVEYEAYVAYQPKAGGTVLGLSKLARITKTLARQPKLQEQLASDIADVLCAPEQESLLPGIKSEGSVVSMIGKHSCMACRGVSSNALTSCTEVRSPRFDPVALEDRFISEVNRICASSLRRG